MIIIIGPDVDIAHLVVTYISASRFYRNFE